MIFVPSQDGLSHNPKEFTSKDDIEAGGNILLRLILDIAGGDNVKEKIKVGAAQLGPINLDHSRQEIIQRLINLMMEASDSGADLVVYPELALTTFFPRWFIEEEDSLNLDDFYETEMPNSSTKSYLKLPRNLK